MNKMKFKKIIAVILTVILIMSSTSIMATADVKSNNQSNKETLYETLLKEKRLKKVPLVYSASYTVSLSKT